MEWQRPKWNFFGKFFFYLSSWFSTIFYNRIITDGIKNNLETNPKIPLAELTEKIKSYLLKQQ